jgi:hypothetical protein
LDGTLEPARLILEGVSDTTLWVYRLSASHASFGPDPRKTAFAMKVFPFAWVAIAFALKSFQYAMKTFPFATVATAFE